MAEGNGKNGDLPTWVYRAALASLVAGVLWIGNEIRGDVKVIGAKVAHHDWRLDQHEKTLAAQQQELVTAREKVQALWGLLGPGGVGR